MIHKTLFQGPFNSFDSFNSDIIKPVFGEITPFKKSFKAQLNEAEKQIMEDVICWGEMDLATHGDQMQFFEVLLLPKVKLSVSRVSIQAFIRRELLPYTAALIVFHYPHNPTEWRISFVSKGRNATDATSAKRYTYLVGDDQACRTVAKRFDELTKKPKTLENITEAFSVEKLSDDFFETYRNIYADFVQHITGKRYVKEKGKWIESTIQEPDEQLQSAFDGDEKSVRDYVKKMMGRLVFLQFLQKKGWLGVPADKPWGEGDQHFLQNLFAKSNHKDDFLDKVLEPLLFETLNDGERANEIADARLGENIKIPYLNGGLFESDALDKRKVIFPADLFKDLFQFFSEYNFTIDENDPNDAEVGVDPEMLGRIFENLLEDNKDKGAFYTPKEIVQYMCRESLIAYLTTDNESMLEAIKQLVMQHKTESLMPEQKRMLLTKLKAVKVCDPAIGSGAFPMGMLQEIYQCIVALDGKAENTVDIKKHIIQNSIYGVDLEKGAVDIARLRFWLALVVDEEKPQPLPNLDYKIMQGNSLLESFEGVDLSIISEADNEMMISGVEQLTFGEEFEAPKVQLSIFDKSTKEDLSKLLGKYFDIQRNNKEKENLKNRITEIVDGKIHSHIQQKLRKTIDSYKILENKWLNVGIIDFNLLDKNSKEYKLYLSKKNEAYRLTEVENKLIELNENSIRPFFLWHLWFKDVFDKGGFDILIGNPPYIQLQKNGGLLAKEFEQQNFQTFERTGDIYSLFYEKGIQLLKNKGILTYITSNKWMRAGYGKSTRAFFCEHEPLKIIDLGSGVFDTATVDTNILTIRKIKQKPQTYSLKALDISKERNIIDFDLFNNRWITLNKLSDDCWNITNELEQRIKTKVETKGIPLKDWDIDIYRGITTGYNEAFIVDNTIKNEICLKDPKSIKILKPVLRGKDIKKFNCKWAGLWMITTHNGYKDENSNKIPPIFIDEYFAVKEHLDKYLPQLENRIDKGFTPYNLRNCAYQNEFEKEKIILTKASKEQSFCLDIDGYYLLNTSYFISTKFSKYLIAILNSKLCNYFFVEFYQSGGINGEITIQSVLNLPIPFISEILQKPFKDLVELIISKKLNDLSTIIYEQKLDNLVYKLYDLTYEEVKVVDPEFGLSEEEYAMIEID